MTLAISEGEILIGLSQGGSADEPVTQRLDRSNRHGVVAGATGTGKTVTLQVMAQAFADAGVPVFAADVKGDLSGSPRPARPTRRCWNAPRRWA
jgi:MoxR-like ATPase